MAREITTAPPKGPEAFTRDADVYAQAQAAILLSMGVQLRGDDVGTAARSAAARQPTEVLEASANVEVAAEDDFSGDDFPVPPLAPTAERVPFEVSRDITAAVTNMAMESAEPPQRTALAERVYSDPSPENAAALIHASLYHEDPLVRVAAAAAALPVSTDVTVPLAILREGTRDQEPLVREVAATALARFDPADESLRGLRIERPVVDTAVSMDAAVAVAAAPPRILVHGTWATNNAWWQPGGDFFQFTQGGVWPDVYGAADRYSWSGGYSDAARAAGAAKLVAWSLSHSGQGMSLMCHSHGASVAMLATFDPSIRFDKLRFLSSPVHPAKYKVNFAQVGSVRSVRVRWDLVLLADGGGSKFTDPRYNDHVLPVWFNHSATHEPGTWTKYGVAALLQLP